MACVCLARCLVCKLKWHAILRNPKARAQTLRGQLSTLAPVTFPAPSLPNIAPMISIKIKFEPNAHSRAVSDAVLCCLAGTLASATTSQTGITDANVGGAGRAPTVKQASRDLLIDITNEEQTRLISALVKSINVL